MTTARCSTSSKMVKFNYEEVKEMGKSITACIRSAIHVGLIYRFIDSVRYEDVG